MLPGKTDLVFTIVRGVTIRVPGAENFTPGTMYQSGIYFCRTCEDEDRHLEKGGEKVYGKTAIPRGLYRLTVSMSARFGKLLPEVKDVPEFTGVRCHGGNKAEHSEGCVLVGKVATQTGIYDCTETVAKLIEAIQAAEAAGRKCWLEIK